jgi:hypothetical protein
MSMASVYRRALTLEDEKIAAECAAAGRIRYEYQIQPNGQCVRLTFLPNGCVAVRGVEWVRA